MARKYNSLDEVADIVKRCPVCGDAIEAIVKPGHAFSGKVIHPMCACEAKIRDEREAGHDDESRQYKILENKRNCFSDPRTATSSFKWDKRRKSDVSKAVRKYVADFDKMADKGLGLLLHGPVGTGKSFYAACVCNALLEHEKVCLFTSVKRLIDFIDADYQGRSDRLDSLAKYDLIVIDDFAKERRTDYVDEQIIDIMDKIYSNYIPLIVTTNMDPAEMISNDDLFYQRVYSRIIEMCAPIKVEGKQRYAVASANRQQFLNTIGGSR